MEGVLPYLVGGYPLQVASSCKGKYVIKCEVSLSSRLRLHLVNSIQNAKNKHLDSAFEISIPLE